MLPPMKFFILLLLINTIISKINIKKMKLKKLSILTITIALIVACDATPKKKETKNIDKSVEVVEKKEVQTNTTTTRFVELTGYFVKNDITFDNTYEFVAVSNQKDFDANFGIAKTMDNEVTPLDFEKFNIVAILVKPSNQKNEIKIDTYTANNGKMLVGFSNKLGEEQSFTSGELLLFKIPKAITNIDFVSGSLTVNIKVN